MDLIASMIDSHPSLEGDATNLRNAIVTAYECAQICTTCADSCLAEREVDALSTCIRTNLDCAEICLVTGSMLSRVGSGREEVLRGQLRTCHLALRACEEECTLHAERMNHCRICAQACRAAREALARLLEAEPSPHQAELRQAAH